MTATTEHESLMQALQRVPAPRSRRGRRYELASMLGLAVCAMAQWGREQSETV
jgi:hypothetical protein